MIFLLTVGALFFIAALVFDICYFVHKRKTGRIDALSNDLCLGRMAGLMGGIAMFIAAAFYAVLKAIASVSF